MPWYAHAATTFDPETGLFSEDLKGLATNPASMAAGDAGAPRIQGHAIASDNNGLTVISVIAADTVNLTAGMTPISGITATSSAVYVLGFSYTVNAYTGFVRFKASHSSGSGTSSLQLRKNGVAISTFTNGTASAIIRTVDSAVNLGDTFQWWHSNSFSGNASILESVIASASDGYVERPVYWLQSQS